MNQSFKMTVMVAVFTGGLLLMAGCGGEVTVPTSFDSYNSTKGTFACEYPSGWECKGGGKRGPSWAKFSSGSAEIKIDTGIVGSVLVDIGDPRDEMGGGQVDDDLAPAAKVHEAFKANTAAEFNDYKEEAPQVARSKLGDGRKSKFTAAASFGGEICGYRATIVNKKNSFVVICQCSKGDWEKLKPAFDRVLASLARGKAEF